MGGLQSHLQSGDAGEEAEEVQGRREERGMVTVRQAEHLLGRVGSDHGVLVGGGHALVHPCSDVEPPHLAELGLGQGQRFRPRHVRSGRHQHFRQVDILCTFTPTRTNHTFVPSLYKRAGDLKNLLIC